MKKAVILLIILAAVLLSFGYFKYYLSYEMDLQQMPWAYSKDKSVKLFVGKWAGEFKDPDGVYKKMDMEIFVPLTDDERMDKSSKRKSRSLFKRSKTGFHGIAKVTSTLGTEDYEIWGGFEDKQFHKFHFNVANEKNFPVANFYLAGAKYGIWDGDQINMTMPFNYRKANGTSYYSSDDPRYEQTAVFVMHRQ